MEREQRATSCIGASLSLVLSMEYKWAWLVKAEIPTVVQVLVYLSHQEKGGFALACLLRLNGTFKHH
jgi:hypothetical protein